MKVTRSAAYALHVLMFMVRHHTQLPVTANMVAKAEGIPSDYLAKIFQRLVKADFVKAIRRQKRGYVFAKPPERLKGLTNLLLCYIHSIKRAINRWESALKTGF